jgi:hypothetical protein
MTGLSVRRNFHEEEDGGEKEGGEKTVREDAPFPDLMS